MHRSTYSSSSEEELVNRIHVSLPRIASPLRQGFIERFARLYQNPGLQRAIEYRDSPSEGSESAEPVEDVEEPEGLATPVNVVNAVDLEQHPDENLSATACEESSWGDEDGKTRIGEQVYYDSDDEEESEEEYSDEDPQPQQFYDHEVYDEDEPFHETTVEEIQALPVPFPPILSTEDVRHWYTPRWSFEDEYTTLSSYLDCLRDYRNCSRPSKVGVVAVRSYKGRNDKCGRGWDHDSLWAVKYCEEKYVNDGLKNEIKVYQHITKWQEQDRKLGHSFLMFCEATFQCQIGPMHQFVMLPLAQYDLRIYLSFVKKDEVRALTAQLALGIATLHDMGIIHGDLKPEHIVVDDQYNIKIIDFASAIFTEPQEDTNVRRKLSFSPSYAAPELHDHEESTFAADYWSLGCIFFELVMSAYLHPPIEEDNHILFEYISIIMWKESWGFDEEREECLPKNRKMPDVNSFSLLTLLLNPSPETRINIRNMIEHPFFVSHGGYSEFELLNQCLDTDKVDIPHPKGDIRRRTFRSLQQDGSTYRWINPSSTFFPRVNSAEKSVEESKEDPEP